MEGVLQWTTTLDIYRNSLNTGLYIHSLIYTSELVGQCRSLHSKPVSITAQRYALCSFVVEVQAGVSQVGRYSPLSFLYRGRHDTPGFHSAGSVQCTQTLYHASCQLYSRISWPG